MHSIGINAHLLSKEASYRRAGIHYYIAEVLNHLPAESFRYTVFTDDPPDFLYKRPAFTVNRSPWHTERPLLRIAWEQAVWPLAAVREKVDLLHSMAFVTPWLHLKPTVVTVYDLSYVHYPERFPKAQQLYLATQTARSCRWARRIIAISESGRDDLHHFWRIPLEKIDVVYPGIDGRFRPQTTEDIQRFKEQEQLPERFILHVGTLQPRKNIAMLIEAFSQLKDDSCHLVLVGGKGWLYDEIFARVNDLGLQTRVHFPGYVADEVLPLWYSAADLFVLPSVYEGFGMPLIQAMACGTPVIAANISAMPEAVGEAGLLFDPQDVVALAKCMAGVLDNPGQAATMRARGLVQAGKFSWIAAGKQTAAVYAKALG